MLNKMKNKINQNVNLDSDIITPKKEGYTTAIKYGLFGFLWILFSDKILLYFFQDIEMYQELQTYKGWFFVFISMILIYYLVKSRSALYQESIHDLQSSYEELESVYEELEASSKEILEKEEVLQYEKKLNQRIFDYSNVFIILLDSEGNIKRVNPFVKKMLGYCEEALIDRNWVDFLVPKEDIEFSKELFKYLKKRGKLINYEINLKTNEGKMINILWNGNKIYSKKDKESLYLFIGIDLSYKVELENELENTIYIDNLTGLKNRKFLTKELNENIDKNNNFALVILDIDNFKFINEKYGHNIGDEVLKTVANKLINFIKDQNQLIRLSGDEYAILIYEDKDKVLKNKITSLINYLGKQFNINSNKIYLSFTLGVSKYPKDAKNSIELLKNADIALHKAKKSGKKRVLFYKSQFKNSKLETISLANDLEDAIENENFELYFQPQFNLKTKKLYASEVLVRWNHKDKGFISPGKFIKVAEDTGQIYALERWIFSKALSYKKEFENMDTIHKNMEVSINLSSKSLMNEIAFENLIKLLDGHKINYNQIVIEITETAVIDNIQAAIDRLNRLRNYGMKIALDDFGTGYSSLNYLKQLPINIVKFDKSFIDIINKSIVNEKIINSMLRLSKDLGYSVVAEGIETDNQLKYLQKHNCDFGQGYFLSKPKPKESFLKEIKF
ncbi:MAG: sensor domain-containing protein [Bacillota bacterium]